MKQKFHRISVQKCGASTFKTIVGIFTETVFILIQVIYRFHIIGDLSVLVIPFV